MSTTSRSRRALPAIAFAGVCAVVLSGCVRPLFPKGDMRTQYDNYDLVRNQYEPDYIYDEYGRRTPNLRGRLNPNAR